MGTVTSVTVAATVKARMKEFESVDYTLSMTASVDELDDVDRVREAMQEAIREALVRQLVRAFTTFHGRPQVEAEIRKRFGL